MATSRNPAPADASDAGHSVATSLTMLARLATSQNPAPADARDTGRLVATSGKATLAGAHDAGQAGKLSKPGPC